MSDNKILIIEEAIIGAVKSLLCSRVNDIIADWQFLIPIIEFSGYSNSSVITPEISLAVCEKTEKERIIYVDVYVLAIKLHFKDFLDSELFCYAYSTAIEKALKENNTLGGIADRAVISNKKYTPPKSQNCGEGWSLTISLRITVEGMKI